MIDNDKRCVTFPLHVVCHRISLGMTFVRLTRLEVMFSQRWINYVFFCL